MIYHACSYFLLLITLVIINPITLTSSDLLIFSYSIIISTCQSLQLYIVPVYYMLLSYNLAYGFDQLHRYITPLYPLVRLPYSEEVGLLYML